MCTVTTGSFFVIACRVVLHNLSDAYVNGFAGISWDGLFSSKESKDDKAKSKDCR